MKTITRSVTILGSTGVVGTNTLDVMEHLGEGYGVRALAAGRNMEILATQVRKFRPEYVSVQDEAAALDLRMRLSDVDWKPEIGVGEDGLITAARVDSDVVVSAIVGARGLLPTWEAIERGATIALANKETLVTAGDLVMPFARQKGAKILPVDSEHSALYQSLLSGRQSEVERYVLTASGGPFRSWSKVELEHVTVEQALNHPNWVMGRKITVDSASLMNKGLEVIEAHHLFAAPYDKIEVVVHPQSVIHSMVEFIDGSMVAQMATADMRIPIQYALTHEDRVKSPWPRLDLLRASTLTFEAPDLERFPSLRLAYEAGRAGGYAPCVLNAANEVAVEAFLERRISFSGMAKLVEGVLLEHHGGQPRTIDEVLEMDAWSRRLAQTHIGRGRWRV